ncbi:hypothetical protein Q644_08265 [Brucella intermedia 229E]|uniref:Uncharacterized protein n=1 Tax=Brucella intermedia 229E TaxID=1337887 RepID=U4V4C7_9HYPH|nr:hypothetical protein Q644_08265 [Brucella intermedia 229E]
MEADVREDIGGDGFARVFGGDWTPPLVSRALYYLKAEASR